MKMIVCILQDSDRDDVAAAPAIEHVVQPGVEDDEVEAALQIIRETVKDADSPGMKRATLFVLNVDQFRQF